MLRWKALETVRRHIPKKKEDSEKSGSPTEVRKRRKEKGRGEEERIRESRRIIGTSKREKECWDGGSVRGNTGGSRVAGKRKVIENGKDFNKKTHMRS
jgi:hypothetical protein